MGACGVFLWMIQKLFALLGAVMLMAGSCFAADPTHDLTAQQAVKLINMQLEGHEQQIEIALIVDGTGKAGPFEVKHVRRVVAVHPVLENGRMVRRACHYDFLWNDTYGWFTWKKVESRGGGDEIWIWSELKGELVIK